MQQDCPQSHEEVPSALETLLLESASYVESMMEPFVWFTRSLFTYKMSNKNRKQEGMLFIIIEVLNEGQLFDLLKIRKLFT
jgi:hypothetical protein